MFQSLQDGLQRAFKSLRGKGKLSELVIRSKQLAVDLIVFDRNLSAAQIRNIAGETDQRIVDRTQLILDIFAQNAHSRDGKIQVELAQLKYLLPRLTGRGTAMSRLAGGIGARGPGESKLETDRRLIRKRIAHLERQIVALAKGRSQRRSLRKSERLPIVSIVSHPSTWGVPGPPPPARMTSLQKGYPSRRGSLPEITAPAAGMAAPPSAMPMPSPMSERAR